MRHSQGYIDELVKSRFDQNRQESTLLEIMHDYLAEIVSGESVLCYQEFEFNQSKNTKEREIDSKSMSNDAIVSHMLFVSRLLEDYYLFDACFY